jgi:peptidoglycan/LPS O-acetylase OafA/YrhL
MRAETRARSDRAASPYLRVLPYAPGLDGVRALAVAAVLLYHARVAWAPGGFLGVDVFFVLSGYLITSLLLAEHRRSGRIDLRRFWIGRARRLLPAAVLVICVCLAVGAVFLRGDLSTLRADSLASLLYVNNWHQVLASHSYFAAFGRPSLLQHYWSLSVEEQFYVVWPVLMTVGFALGRSRRWLASLVLTAGAASVALMVVLYHPGLDPSRVYYGTDTRAAALMIGTLLAFAWPLGRMTARAGRLAGTVLDGVGLAGLAGLVVLVVSWHDYDPFLYRGGFIVAALAAAAVIAAAVHPASRIGGALGMRPLRWIGQRSYGIYLWHWPVMALMRPRVDVRWPGWILVLTQVAITLVLAALSYRYVEMPIRRGGAIRALTAWLDRRRPRQRLAAAATTLLVTGALVAVLASLPASAGRSPFAPLQSASAATRAEHRSSTRAVYTAPPSLPAPARAVHPRPRSASGVQATIVADSVGETIEETPESVTALTHGLRVHLDLKVCRRLLLTSCTYQGQTPVPALQTVKSLGRSIGPLLIVEVGYNDDPTGYGAGIDQIMRVALAHGARQVVWLTLRESGNDAPTYHDTNAVIRAAAHRWPQLRVADWNAYSDGRPWFSNDDVHPSAYGAVALARYLRSYIGVRP